METPDDYVLATNETHPVREFVERAFKFVKIDVKWLGEKGTVSEIGVDAKDESRVLVRHPDLTNNSHYNQKLIL